MNVEGKELFVGDIKTNRSGSFIVFGVPNNGKAIHVGDVFKTRYDARLTMEDILNERPRPAPTNCVEISLTVVAITSLRQQIEELPPGVSGALHLTGNGVESITPRCYLMT